MSVPQNSFGVAVRGLERGSLPGLAVHFSRFGMTRSVSAFPFGLLKLAKIWRISNDLQ